MRRLPAPPSNVTGALGAWLQQVHAFLEVQPNVSLVSLGATETPNSRVTGTAGDLCVNVGSASTDSRLWLMGGNSVSARTDQGWALVRIVR